MKNVQYMEDSQGKKFAILPTEELEKLQGADAENLNELIDIHIAKEILANNEETIPNEVIHRIFVDDENPIRVYRQWRGYSVKELAEKVGVAPSYISNIENGKRDGTISLYQKIAKALDTDIIAILPPMPEGTESK